MSDGVHTPGGGYVNGARTPSPSQAVTTDAVTNAITNLRTQFNRGLDRPETDLVHDMVANTTVPNLLRGLRSQGERQALVNWLRDNGWGTYEVANEYRQTERGLPAQ